MKMKSKSGELVIDPKNINDRFIILYRVRHEKSKREGLWSDGMGLYMVKVFEEFGFGCQFVLWITMLCAHLSSSSLTTQDRLVPSSLHRGTHSGCTLSPLLFAIAIDPYWSHPCSINARHQLIKFKVMHRLQYSKTKQHRIFPTISSSCDGYKSAEGCVATFFGHVHNC